MGTLQEILLDDKFEKLQRTFCQEHCMHFDATEENKLIYTDLFKRYQETVEAFITQRLKEELPDSFAMEAFLKEVTQRKDEIDE